VGEDNRRDLQVHRTDSEAGPGELSILHSGTLIEIEDDNIPKALDMRLEPCIGIDLLGDGLRPSHVGHPTSSLLLIGDDRRGPGSGIKTIQPGLKALACCGLPSFEEAQVIGVENDHRSSFSGVVSVETIPATRGPVS